MTLVLFTVSVQSSYPVKFLTPLHYEIIFFPPAIL